MENLEGVSEVEAELQSFQTVLIDDTRYTVKVQSLSEKMDVPIIVEGTLPEHSDEIAIHDISAEKLGIIVGLILGCLMGSLTVASIEPITGTFVKSADLVAIITGILGSTILAIIMSMIALRRVNKFDLTDINRF